IPAELVRVMGAERATTLRQVLALDPRPHYHHDANKVYGMPYEGHDVRFRVEGDVLTVVEVL
ncbi:MAG TPA: tRNA (N6-threonylcarbamoyladenosine(37)-N6)-methyltransferase TrmO, partial [Prevotella sp.]|nr:tRNA (N6-threonylcarbamoyladenosine(37)-N6)-methyltransferase TrmO [Prevotella sp.]